MSTFGIVALSILGGLFLALLLAGISVVSFATFRLLKATASINKTIIEFQVQIPKDLATILESSKSNLTSLRTEIRASLEQHRKEINEAITQINAQELVDAAKRAHVACGRMEKIAKDLHDLLLDAERGEPEMTEEEAVATAPAGSTIYDIGAVSKLDRQAATEEQATGT